MAASFTMTFHSILFDGPKDNNDIESATPPAFFPDLNCDQIVDDITAPKAEYDLKPFFYACPRSIEAVNYRHDVMKDLDKPDVLEHVRSLAARMRGMRGLLTRAEKSPYKEERQAWFLDAVEMYCDALVSFAEEASGADLKSRGCLGFLDHLKTYIQSAEFARFSYQTKALKSDLAGIEYCVRIKNGGVTVRKYEGEADYSAEIESVFEKFKQGAPRDYRSESRPRGYLNHVEAKILELVARLNPEVFGRLDDYCSKNADYIDPIIAAFDREVQFYIAYIDYIAPLKQAGLSFCYPVVSSESKEICSEAGFDLALAHKLAKDDKSVICNDFFLKGEERILVVSGPNQGGKTTFARALGQLHYLASIGLPVPGRHARLFAFDHLLTHFEKEEAMENLRGKLEDDLTRIHDILDRATPRSIIILNEIFASTTLFDEMFLSIKIVERISALGALCVWVTFVDELASLNQRTVSMVSTVDPENPAVRTFRILRRPADGLAYAMAIAKKHRLTLDSILERIESE
ncbi:MAG TPA: DNA mismatch repair protein MutS [Blastocatellia bacterium]